MKSDRFLEFLPFLFCPTNAAFFISPFFHGRLKIDSRIASRSCPSSRRADGSRKENVQRARDSQPSVNKVQLEFRND